jgi:hypothetical protein
MLKKRESEIAAMDKYITSTILISAIFQDALGNWEQAMSTIQEAIRCAEAFDKEPCFNTKNLIFMEEIEEGYVYDSLGITAKQGLVRLLDEFHLNEMTSERFKEYFRKEIEKEG